jgi:hypothetical protein
MSDGWLAAQRHEENLLDRPLKVAACGTGVGVLIFVITGIFGLLPWMFAAVGLVACALILVITGYAICQGEFALRSRVNEERARLERESASRQRRLDAAHEEHARAYREWERLRQAYETQQEWYPVSVPPGVDRVDVVGGTLTGWSATVTMMGAARLAAGSQVTVLDLSEGAVAYDLLRLAGDRGDDPLVWVLPADLSRLDLTRDLGPEAMADVLSLVVSASEERSSTRDLSFDNAILERILGVFDGKATVRQLTAALRALAQVGDPRDDLRLGLITEAQLSRITTMFGRGAADQVVIERAWALEAQLRKLEVLGTEPVRLPPSRLHVVSMDRKAGVLTNRVLGTYVATALTHVLREAPAGRRWEHTLFLCGAEKLRGDVLDRLVDACETTGTGLVLMYRSIAPHVRERLGRGHAAVGFMRLGNAEDARIAAEHIGVERRLLVAGITDTAGEAVADLKSGPYASTVAYARARDADALTDPVWSPLPDPAEDDEALAHGISTSTPWGRSVVEAAGSGEADGEHAVTPALGASARPNGRGSRELLVEQHQMQELPPTAMVFTHATANGRRILLVDANPGIMTLPTAHSTEYDESLRDRPGMEPPDPNLAGVDAADTEAAGMDAAAGTGGELGAADPAGADAPRIEPERGADKVRRAVPRAADSRARHAAPPGGSVRTPRSAPPLPSPAAGRHAAGGEAPPNLGPPPERLDFRRKKR